MLSLLTLAMLATFMGLILSGRASPIVALVLTPIAFALIAGVGAGALGAMMLEGVRQLAPTAVMLAFAIWYFCLMSDAGLFDPIVRTTLRLVREDPVRIVLGTAVLGLLVSLDGDGATTYIICVTALLPVYKRVGVNPLILTCLLMLACGLTNLTPWGGPTARVAIAVGAEVEDVFLPLVPALGIGALFVIALAYVMGVGEARRLSAMPAAPQHGQAVAPDTQTEMPAATAKSSSSSQHPADDGAQTRRPKVFWFNLALTSVLMVALVIGLAPLSVLFIIASTLALLVNYPSPAEQKARLAAHAPNILNVVMVTFAAGIFIGVLTGAGMSAALAEDVVDLIPGELAGYLAPITALLSLPFTFFMTNDPFFFGVVPVIAEAAAQQGAAPVEIGRAALLDCAVHLLSPIVPSTHLLVSMAGVEFSRHQRFTLPWAIVLALVVIAAAGLTGAFPFHAASQGG